MASIRFSFMVPVFDDVLSPKDFRNIAERNPGYANVIAKEYAYCKSHEAEIHKKALQVYRIGGDRNHPLNSVCCDFKKLEDC